MNKKEIIVLHISLDGSDGWSGLCAAPLPDGADGPLRSFQGARDKLRRMRTDGKLLGPVEVLVHAGLYVFTETLRFEAEDLGSEEAPILFRDAGDGEVILAGGVLLKGFVEKETGLYTLDLRDSGLGGLNFRQLFIDGERQTLARYPNYDHENPRGGGFLFVDLHADGSPASMYEHGHGEEDRFFCHDPRLKEWSRIEEVELFIFPRFNWVNDIIRIKSYDPETGEIVLTKPCQYPIYPGDRFYFQNIREELSELGEWYLDQEKDILYIRPENTPADAVITVPCIDDLLVVVDVPESQKHISSPSDCRRGFLTFRGFTFEGCDGTAVTFRNVRACALEKCVIRNTGEDGLHLYGGAACRMEGCDMYAIGAIGVDIDGGIRLNGGSTLAPSEHEVVNNYLHHIGVFNKGRWAICISGLGARVAHNLIHDIPRIAIFFRGSNHIVEYNRIRHICLETSDGGAINKCDRDLTMRHCKIRYNHIHHVTGLHWDCWAMKWITNHMAFGIYLDDWTSHTDVVGNLIHDVGGCGVFVHSGQANLIENNIVARAGGPLVLFEALPDKAEFNQHATYGQGMRRNHVRRNIYVSGTDETAVQFFKPALAPWPPTGLDAPLPGDGLAEIPNTLAFENETLTPIETEDDPLDLFRVLRTNRDTRTYPAAFLFRVIESDTDQTVEWNFSADRAKQIWINGDLILDKLDAGDWFGRLVDQENATLPLRKGMNVLAIRLHAGRMWQLLAGELPSGMRWSGPWRVFGPFADPEPEESACLVPEADGRTAIRINCWKENLISVSGDKPTVYFRGTLSWEEWRSLGFDEGSVTGDPCFVDAENDDYRLREDSPALNMGFEPLPLGRIGPYKDPLRASWPIVEAEGVRERPLIPPQR